jgi:hypothetical protein
MTFSSVGRDRCFEGYDHAGPSGNARSQRIFGGATLTCLILACGWTLCVNLAGTSPDRSPVSPQNPLTVSRPYVSPAKVAQAYARLAVALNTARQSAASRALAALFDARATLSSPPGRFVSDAVHADPRLDVTASIPSTVPDGEELTTVPTAAGQAADGPASPARRLRPPQTRTAPLRAGGPASDVRANRPADKASIFERLFGRPSSLTLAYAAPDDGMPSGPATTRGRYDRWTAVYDISAHTVYLPDGTELEAHSGLGAWLDDPRHADERMRGTTPPNVYDLELRAGLFHGVQALRLIPADDEKVFGRTGLLAHSFMLGPNGQSNGCVSFRNYEAFLNAYLTHEIKRLVVVARLD